MTEPIAFLDGRVSMFAGDCLDVLAGLPENSVDSVVTDPPYGLQFMGREWDKLWRNGTEADAAYVERTKGELTSLARKLPDYSTTKPSQMQQWHEAWARAVLRVLKPGGHMVAFSGTRTYHRMVCAIEDAGFEIRDCIMWVYGSGFPKSHDVSKGIDRMAGAEREIVGPKMRPDGKTALSSRPNGFNGEHEGWDRPWKKDPLQVALQGMETAPATDAARQWQGWGSALKPALEPICLARKPLSEKSIAATVLRWGTGALNIDGCRVGTEPSPSAAYRAKGKAPSTCKPGEYGDGHAIQNRISPERWLEERSGEALGRWPANLILDGSEEVTAAFPESASTPFRANDPGTTLHGGGIAARTAGGFADNGSAARFFYSSKPDNGRDGESSADRRYTDEGATNFAALPGARRDAVPPSRIFYSSKADATDRLGSKHPTVKPLDLMQYLCRLITPPGGTVLDLFAGTGTTGEAAWREGMNAILIEREAEYQADIARRMELAVMPAKRSAIAKSKGRLQGAEGTPLFPEGNEAAE